MTRPVCHDYDDILNARRPVCRRAKPLSGTERAAQFSPFAALTGYEAALAEAARPTEADRTLGPDEAALLDAQQAFLRRTLASGQRPAVTVWYFVPDERKAGGAVRRAAGRLRTVDEGSGALVLESGRRIPLAAVRRLACPLFPEELGGGS